MTRALKQLLGNDHPLFSSNLAALEKATGGAGVDAKLLGDITEQGHRVLRRLGLDTANTTGEEAYYALNNFAKNEASRRQFAACDFVIIAFNDELVSFNLQDVIENSHHQLKYSDRILGHAQRHLRAEIIRRYAGHDRTHDEVVHQMVDEIGLKQPHDDEYPSVHEPVSDSNPLVLAIGDIFTDAFIQLSEESARIDTDEDGTKRLSLPFGQKPSYDHVDIIKSVGPSPNAAISCVRLGVDSMLLAWLGDDQPGRESLEHLRSEGVDTALMVTQPNTKSTYWYVLRYGSDRTMLVKSEPYKYEFKAPEKKPDWIYLAHCGEDSWPMHEQLIEYLDEHQDIQLAFQPGTYHFKWGLQKLASIYKRAHIVIMNREEAMDVTGKSHDSVRELANALHELGPQIVVITDGPHGSYASYGQNLVTIPNYPDPAPPLDRTGAGDAFASTIIAALALGESMDAALTWAPINSMSVVQKMGAQAGLLSRDKLDEYLKNAPDDYKVTEVTE